METTQQQATQTAKTQSFYSGFWVRLAAHIIDNIIVMFLSFFIGLPFRIALVVVGEISHSDIIQGIAGILGVLISMAIGWGYYIIMTHRFDGATVGKKAVGVKVVDENLTALSLKNIMIREIIGKFISGLILGFGYLMIGFTRKKQGLHDYIAHSCVVYANPEKGPNKAVVWIVYGVVGFCVLMMLLILLISIFALGQFLR